jgi:DNA-binding HxlR family transcriptional regulator
MARRRPRHRTGDPGSSAFEAVRKVGNECRMVIIRNLLDAPRRFSELERIGAGIEPKTLARVLRYLESEGIVRRTVVSTRPMAVQYALTEKGRQLRPVLESLRTWGDRWIAPTPE